MGNSVLWIRNDFRFHDNTALISAINDIKDNENLIFMGTSKNTSRASRASNLSLIYSLFLVNFCL